MRGGENAKVRSLILPVEFDDAGNPKKLSKKDLDERRDKSGLPGFPTEFDSIKPGQYVEIYMVKQVATKKDGKKKGPDDDDPPMTKTGQEYVLIVILTDGKQ